MRKTLLALLLLLGFAQPSLAYVDLHAGDWTPVAIGSTGSGILTYTTQAGTWVESYDTVTGVTEVTVWGHIAWDATSGSFTGYAEISGLPFPAMSGTGWEFDGDVLLNAASSGTAITNLKLAPNTSVLELWNNAGGQAYPVGGIFTSAPGDISFTITYRIN